MRITAKLAIWSAVAGCAWSSPSVSSVPRLSNAHLIICMSFGPDVPRLTGANKLAQNMLAEIGVKTDWPQRGALCAKGGDIRITLSYQTPASKLPGAFAYALPYEGRDIVVFWDRILRKVSSEVAPILLAHVLVHEIAHILQGISRHSGAGIMKAAWGPEDYFQMRKRPLEFMGEDILLIHRGLAARRLVVPEMAAPVGLP